MDINEPNLERTTQTRYPPGAKEIRNGKEVSVGGQVMTKEKEKEYKAKGIALIHTDTGAVSKEQFEKFRDEFKKHVDNIANQKFGEGFAAQHDRPNPDQPKENMSKLFDTLAAKINSQLSILNNSISNLRSSSENSTNKLINFSSAIHGEVAGHTDILQQIADNIGNNSGNSQPKQLTLPNSENKNSQTKLATLILRHLGKIEKHLSKIESSLVASSTKVTPLPTPIVHNENSKVGSTKESNKVIMSKGNDNKMSKLELFLDGITKLISGTALVGLGAFVKDLTENFEEYKKTFEKYKEIFDQLAAAAGAIATTYAAFKAESIGEKIGKVLYDYLSKTKTPTLPEAPSTSAPNAPDNKPKTKPSGEPTKKPPMDMEKLEPYGKRDGESPSGESSKTKPSGESSKTKPSGESKVSKKQSKISNHISKTTDVVKKGAEVAKSVGGKVIEKVSPYIDKLGKFGLSGLEVLGSGPAIAAQVFAESQLAIIENTEKYSQLPEDKHNELEIERKKTKERIERAKKFNESQIVPNVGTKNAAPISATTNNIKTASTELAAQAIPVKNDKPIVVNNTTNNNNSSGSNIGSIASPKNTDSSKEVLDRMMLFGSYTGTGFLLN